ncbi:MAG TPA: hypothetical protein VJH03_25005 [Blastocatellia bacterium]|nr:hypothetical protein [Blastocatellia bacterium]
MKNVMQTPGGLKIRLDPERVDRVLAPVRNSIDLSGAYVDLELWAGFPNAFSSVCTILIAVTTHSLFWTLAAFFFAFAFANALQQFTYSRILNVLFPAFLGGWIIVIPASIAAGVWLFTSGALYVAFLQLAIVVANWLGFTDVLLLPLMPVRIAIRKVTGRTMGDVEIAFIQILDLQVRRAGLQLDWSLYKGRET